MSSNKAYLGDAVYAEWDDFGQRFVLTTEDGIRATNTICLESDVWEALVGYVELIRNANERHTVFNCRVCGATKCKKVLYDTEAQGQSHAD
jgi:hypothetical protein